MWWNWNHELWRAPNGLVCLQSSWFWSSIHALEGWLVHGRDCSNWWSLFVNLNNKCLCFFALDRKYTYNSLQLYLLAFVIYRISDNANLQVLQCFFIQFRFNHKFQSTDTIDLFVLVTMRIWMPKHIFVVKCFVVTLVTFVWLFTLMNTFMESQLSRIWQTWNPFHSIYK